jgi:hypothetical protein
MEDSVSQALQAHEIIVDAILKQRDALQTLIRTQNWKEGDGREIAIQLLADSLCAIEKNRHNTEMQMLSVVYGSYEVCEEIARIRTLTEDLAQCLFG